MIILPCQKISCYYLNNARRILHSTRKIHEESLKNLTRRCVWHGYLASFPTPKNHVTYNRSKMWHLIDHQVGCWSYHTNMLNPSHVVINWFLLAYGHGTSNHAIRHRIGNWPMYNNISKVKCKAIPVEGDMAVMMMICICLIMFPDDMHMVSKFNLGEFGHNVHGLWSKSN